MSISEGQVAPAFSLPASRGRTVSAAKLKGRAYVLYFYPKADTSGCTKEAQQFQGALPEFSRYGVDVIGVSRDPVKALDKFAAKYNLEFPLASDEAGELTEAYGVWVEKSMYGRKYMGIERSTFWIGKDGRVRGVWPKVKVDGHADEVLAAVSAAG
jgi:peroxiredoxin Q/BCP